MPKNDQKDIFEIISNEATNILGEGMLEQLVKDSKKVIGDRFVQTMLDSNITITEKYNLIQQLEHIALSETVKAFNNETKDENRLWASGGLLTLTSTLKSTIKQKEDAEVKEKIDFKNPKVVLAFKFILELVVKILTDNLVEEDKILRILDALTVQTRGLEDKLNEALNKVPISEINQVKNPFINDDYYEDIEYEDIYIKKEEKKPKKKKKPIKKKKSERKTKK